MSARRLFLCLGLLLLAPGCHGYLLPYDERPLPAQASLETISGQRLGVAGDGQLISRPGRGDVGAALGVALYQSEDGLFVANELFPGTGLQRGDRILAALAVLPRTGRWIRQEHAAVLDWASNDKSAQASDVERYSQLEPTSLPQKFRLQQSAPSALPQPSSEDTRPLPSPAPEAFRARGGAHEVVSVEDLRGYVAGAGWLKLDLLLLREGAEVVVRVPVKARESWIPTRPRLPDRGRWRGLELVPIRTLPSDLQPRTAEPGDVLVTRVARGSPLGRAGLRPLDLIDAFSAEKLLGGVTDSSLTRELRDQGVVTLEARGPDGRRKTLEFLPREEPTQLWFPFAFAYERGTGGYHFGLGWWDVLFHASGRKEYSSELDDYVETSRWSLLTLFSGGEERTEEGTVRAAGLNLIYDPVRLEYFLEWLETPTKVRSEWGLEGY